MKRSRRRLQIEIRPEDERAVALLRKAYGLNESEAGHRLLQLFERLVDTVSRGGIWVTQPASTNDAVDALPELTRAVRPETSYEFLVAVPHEWRRQLLLKGRRITVGNLIAQMQANDLGDEDAAREYDLPLEAVREAIHYYRTHHDLVDAELAEERRRAEAAVAYPRQPSDVTDERNAASTRRV